MKTLPLILALLALTGCAALKQALGLETAQTAPTHVTAGIAVFNMAPPKKAGGDAPSGVKITFENIANGDLGSESDGKGGDGSATQTTKVDPEAVADAVKTVAAPAE